MAEPVISILVMNMLIVPTPFSQLHHFLAQCKARSCPAESRSALAAQAANCVSEQGMFLKRGKKKVPTGHKIGIFV